MINQYKITIPKEHWKYLFIQRSILEIIYNLDYSSSEDEVNETAWKVFQEDYLSVRSVMPQNPKNILDIGGGIGVFDTIINDHYFYSIGCDVSPVFHIVDSDSWTIDDTHRQINYGSVDDMATYNNFGATKAIFSENALPEKQYRLYDINKQEFPEEEMDLIYSITSAMWHYPISTYLENLKLKKGGVLILDSRLGDPEIELVNERYRLVKSVYNHYTLTGPKILKGHRYCWVND